MWVNILKGLSVPLIFFWIILQGIQYLHQEYEGENIIPLSQATFLMSDQMSPPDFSSLNTVKRTMPDNWDVSQPDIGGRGWYQLQLNIAKGTDVSRWALFIPRASRNLAAYVNGHEIGSTGKLDKPVLRNCSRPLYYKIPNHTLKIGKNIIDIQLQAETHQSGGVSKLLIGPHEDLYSLYEGRYFLQIDASMIGFFLNIFAGLVALTLWRLRPQDSLYGWFAMISFSSSFFIVNQLVTSIPVSRDTWYLAVHVSIGWFSFSILTFIQHFVGKANKKWEKRLLVYMFIASIVLIISKSTPIALIWHVGSILMTIYACFLLFQKWLKLKEAVYLALFCAISFTLALGFHDWYTRVMHLHFSNPSLMHLGSPVMLMSISWILISRFVQYARENESFQERLIQQIEDTTQKLNVEYAQKQLLEKKEAQVAERERIMKDLHDGLGSYLISANSIARLQNVDQGLQQALHDAVFWLRTSIDTLDSAHEEIDSLLGTLRYRLEPQLKSCGIQLHWEMDDLSSCYLSSENRLHLMRIVQESITNVIKHAHASNLHISTQLKAQKKIVLTIEDDGVGMGSALVAGHGLSNMRERIESMGGEIQLNNNQKGCALQFMFMANTEKELVL